MFIMGRQIRYVQLMQFFFRRTLINSQLLSTNLVSKSDHQLPNKDIQKKQNVKLNLHLCYLTMIQAVPSLINQIMYAMLISRHSSYLIGSAAIDNGLSFQGAMEHLRSKYVGIYLNFFCSLSNDLAHCFHFYLYMIFCRRFRQGFLKKMKLLLAR
jgi:hypothetical protein